MILLSNDIWRPLPGFEGFYETCVDGRMRSCDRMVKTHDNGSRFVKGRVLKPVKYKAGEEYVRYCLSKNGVHTCMFAHTAVALTYLSNPNNYKEVNHKDENPSNNALWNIEYCSHTYNINFGTRSERAGEKTRKGVIQFDMSGNVVSVYKSIKEAAASTNTRSSNIVHCCKGNRTSTGGYIWKYCSD